VLLCCLFADSAVPVDMFGFPGTVAVPVVKTTSLLPVLWLWILFSSSLLLLLRPPLMVLLELSNTGCGGKCCCCCSVNWLILCPDSRLLLWALSPLPWHILPPAADHVALLRLLSLPKCSQHYCAFCVCRSCAIPVSVSHLLFCSVCDHYG